MQWSRCSIVLQSVASVCVVLVLYVLSVGPVVWLTVRGLGPPASFIEVAYWPLWTAKDHSPTVAEYVDAYLYLWVPFPVGGPGPPGPLPEGD